MRALLLALLLVACGPEDPSVLPREVQPQVAPLAEAVEALQRQGMTTLRWGHTPYLGVKGEGSAWQPIIEQVGEALGVEVELVAAADYGDIERMVVDAQIDIATMSPYGYVRARRLSPGLRVFASHVARGSTTYGVYLIAREGGKVQSIEDVVGRRFAYVDRRSTSGWLFPAARMLDEDIDPLADVTPLFEGSHHEVFDAVATGRADAGAVYDHALSTARQSHPTGHEVMVIAKAPRVPFDAYVLRAGLPGVIGEAVAELLAEISTRTPEGRALLLGTPGINGFFPTDDAHYDVIREVEAVVEQRWVPG